MDRARTVTALLVVTLAFSALSSAGTRRIKVGGAIKAPTKVVDVKPVYPPGARDAGIQGVVILDVVISEEGSIIQADIVRSIPELDQAAVDAVTQWKYEPTLLNGESVEVEMNVTINFSLD
jgi:protein TonB